MTRTDNIKRNLIFNTVKFVTQLVLQFVLRTALIYILGAEYLGLNGLFSNIFAFLNLAELGIGSAIVFSMYKPIAEGNNEKVKTLQQLYKKFYFIIATVVATIGILLLPFLKYLINGGVTIDINIYVLYILYLLNTLVGYFSAHKRSLLFAYQRNDVENKIKTLCLFGMTALQIAILLVFKNYYIVFSINIIFTIIECILIHVSANKLYPEINGKGGKLQDDTKKEITQNVLALSMHKIGYAIVFSTDNILISTMLGISILGAYSNYYLITSTLVSIFMLISTSIKSSAGNLVAQNDTQYVYGKYKQVNFIFSALSTFTTICLIVLFQPFIQLWTGGGVYLLNFSTVILLSISFYLTQMRSGPGLFKEVSGLFFKDRFVSIFEAIINLVTSIIFGIMWGINGIILGTIISTICAPLIVEPYVLFKHYFKKSVWEHFKTYIIHTIIMIAICAICYFVCSFIPNGSIWLLIAKFATCIGLSGILLVVAYLPFKEFRELICMAKNFIKNIIYKLKNKNGK